MWCLGALRSWHGGYGVLTCPTGLPVLLTNMELGLECQELQWLLQREQLSPPRVQPGFCLYLSTTLPLSALEKGEAQWVSYQRSFVDTVGPSRLGTIVGSHTPCVHHPCQGGRAENVPCNSHVQGSDL